MESILNILNTAHPSGGSKKASCWSYERIFSWSLNKSTVCKMNYPIRKELVGKRFMCVRDRTTQNSRQNSRSNRFSNPLDYTWKCGIIRACTEQDSNDIEQKVMNYGVIIIEMILLSLIIASWSSLHFTRTRRLSFLSWHWSLFRCFTVLFLKPFVFNLATKDYTLLWNTLLTDNGDTCEVSCQNGCCLVAHQFDYNR